MATLQPIGLPFALQDGILFKVLDFNERYAVCSDGVVLARVARSKLSRVHAWDKWKVVKPWAHRSGHLYVKIEEKSYQVHRLVLSAFARPSDCGEECRHLDGDPKNNRIENLRWGTRAENIADKAVHGTGNQGARHPMAKLTDEQARMARELKSRLSKKGCRGVTTFLARWFGVSQGQMSMIVRGLAY